MNDIKSLLLVDGSSYLYRAFHALPGLTSPTGQPTGAIYGVLTMLQKLIKAEKPDLVGIIFDAPGKTFRHDLFPDYKANREKTPEDLVVQIEPLLTAIQNLGLPLIRIQGVEADDVIGTLARQAENNNIQTLIATGDKDFAQLVSERIKLIDTMKNITTDQSGVLDKFGLRPEQIIDYLALAGDPSDNIPGIPKVGPKTAAKWLQQYTDLNGVIKHAEEIVGKVGEALRTSIPDLALYQKLATIDCNVELEHTIHDLVIGRAQEEALFEQLNTLGLHRLIKQFMISKPETKTQKINNYHGILTKKEFNTLLSLLDKSDIAAIDTETTSLNYLQAEIVGISFAITAKEAYYIPLLHNYDEAPTQLDRAYVLSKLKPWLENSNYKKIGHNLKYDSHIFANHGITLNGMAFDTMLESYVLNSTATRHNLNAVAKRYLNQDTISYEEVAGKGAKQISFNKVSLEDAIPYAAEDADVCFRLHHALYPKLQNIDALIELYSNIESPLVAILQQVERNGVLIDKLKLEKQSDQFAAKLNELEEQAYHLVGSEFNLSSPKQLQEILFDQMGLPVLKKTPKGQPSTAEGVLQELAHDFPIAQTILEHRTIAKLKTTYTDKLPLLINKETQRVHTSYHQAVTSTGRLSSSDPNLQNIPIRSAAGRQIRQAFIAPKGWKILAADYSQIELRIMAHISKDRGLLDAFEKELDIHQATAAEIFDTDLEVITKEQRRSAKAINFGLMYGMSAFGLSRQLSISRQDAEQYIELYFARYPRVKDYMESAVRQARESGFVETVFGRRLYLPDIDAKHYQRRQYAERSAINAPMQGTAADIIKKAMIELQDQLEDSSKEAKMIMQVHDELVLEVQDNAVEAISSLVSQVMSQAADLEVALKVDVGVGNTWDEAH
ncbi:MAG: DNA polymerase I [Candidatus Marinimicrobia bacterium]|jgi:DNA polymerase-1|nr:DNA polymerase I [Candidatus Neomarinimicrobiota bacterium]HJL81330.1 DNA polymerase I [Gammaproteobacteria bacterium]HJP42227.1 DNA polymerase I [Gammaproteobacteria bacterium]